MLSQHWNKVQMSVKSISLVKVRTRKQQGHLLCEWGIYGGWLPTVLAVKGGHCEVCVAGGSAWFHPFRSFPSKDQGSIKTWPVSAQTETLLTTTGLLCDCLTQKYSATLHYKSNTNISRDMVPVMWRNVMGLIYVNNKDVTEQFRAVKHVFVWMCSAPHCVFSSELLNTNTMKPLVWLLIMIWWIRAAALMSWQSNDTLEQWSEHINANANRKS